MNIHQGVLHALSLAPSSLPAMATLAQNNSATVSRVLLRWDNEAGFLNRPLKQLSVCVCYFLCNCNLCLFFQPLKYDSSASLCQQQDGSPAIAASTQTGVKNKVSAWLQQTHDIDATSNGRHLLYS